MILLNCLLKKRYAIGFITCIWLSVGPIITSAQTPYFKSIEPSNIIDQSEVHLLYQDTNGFIWLGTSQGLFKYTGLEYIPYLLHDSLSTQSVSSLFQDVEGTLWVGYQNGKIALLTDNQLSLFLPQEGTPKVAITGIQQDLDSTIWIATYGEGIYYYAKDRLYNIDTDDNLNANEIYSIALDQQGRIWAGTDAGIAICNWDGNLKQVKQLTVADGLPDNIVYQLEPDNKGNIWIGMYEGGVCFYDSKSLDMTIPKATDNWSDGAVTSMAVSNNDVVWIGAEKSGILSLDTSGRLLYVAPQSTKLFDLLADRYGQIWVARQDGVYTANQSLEFINFSSDSNYGKVQAVASDSAGDLWFSTPTGLFHCTYDNGETLKIARYHLPNLPDTLNIISLYIDDAGFIWLGTFDKGVYRFKPHTGSIDHINESDGLINDNVLSISGSGAEIWLATLGGVSKCTLSGTTKSSFSFKNFSKEDGIGVNYIYKVFLDSKGREWFATDGNGIALLDGVRFINYGEEQGVADRIISITEDQNGGMWFSTPDNGIYRFDGSQFQHFSTNEGLVDLEISSLAKEKNGNIVIISQSGLAVLDPQTNHILNYGEESGVIDIDPDINAVAIDKYDHMWIGTQKGIIKFNGTTPSSFGPQTSINNINLYLKPVAVENGHHFDHDQDHISFDYIGLWYRDPKTVSYQHKLEGFDIDWIESRDPSATYPKLAPGTYRFMVKSSITQNFENSIPEQFDFVIRTPFWKKTWFYILSFILGATVLTFLIKAREKRLRKAERTKNELLVAEFETLKSQVNPHFLFNSFNTLMGAIEEDKEIAIEYVEKLSDFFRNMLAYREKSLIRMREELDLVMDYFFLQQKRFGNNLKINVNISPEKTDYLIPPLTLQMLVENAIKHNIISKTRPLSLELFDQDGYLVIKNNKQLKKHLEPSTGFGLQSIIRRYQLLSDKPVKIENEFKHYQVSIPLLKKV